MADKQKKETKKRYATLLYASQVDKVDKLAKELKTSRAALYDEGGELILNKHGKGRTGL